MIGVLVPAHNEAARIAACLESVLTAARHPGLAGEEVRVVVALDDCSDGTAWHCAAHQVETLALGLRCVGAARAAAAQHLIALDARWLASTDADSIVPADWLVGQLAGRHDVFCGVVDLLVCGAEDRDLRERLHRTERWGDGHGRVHGANLGMRVEAYQRAGGFAAVSSHEDAGLVERLRCTGASIQWAGSPCVLTSARRNGRAPEGFAGHLRNLDAGRIPMSGARLLTTSR